MNCPNCQQELRPEKISSTVYWRCHNCGVLWFDNKENDFLSEAEANMLNQLKPRAHLDKQNYRCPRCCKKLKYDAYYFRCFHCGGVLGSSLEIVAEKKAKTRAFSSNLNKPFRLGQLKYVVMITLVAVFLGVNYILLTNLSQKVSIQTQAQQVESNIRIQPVTQNRLAVFFSTSEPYSSSLLFENAKGTWEQAISTAPAISHFLIIERPSEPTTVKIRLVSFSHEEFLTQPISLPQ